jgi:hypothetical protein
MQGQKNTRRRLSALSLACLGWWLLIASAAGAQQAGQVIVEAGELRLILEKAPQGLRAVSLVDTAGKQELLTGDPLPLFSMTVRDTKTKEMRTLTADSGWQQVEVSHEEATGPYKLTFATPVDEHLKGIRVNVTLTSQKNENALTWNLQVANDSPQWSLWHVVFPQIAIKYLGEGGRVFVPVTAGVELTNLWSKADRKGGQIPFDNDYPHYFPPKDGFREGVAELKTAGVYPMPYINGRLWDTHDKGAGDWEFTRVALAGATQRLGQAGYLGLGVLASGVQPLGQAVEVHHDCAGRDQECVPTCGG